MLLDNFYCNGVLSADGHQWTNEGYVTDYIEKAFGGFPRSYPYDGDDAIAPRLVFRCGGDRRPRGSRMKADSQDATDTSVPSMGRNVWSLLTR